MGGRTQTNSLRYLARLERSLDALVISPFLDIFTMRNDTVVIGAFKFMPNTREKFITEVYTESLSALQKVAQSQGRPLQGLVDEALADLIDKYNNPRPRPHVMAEYLASHKTYEALYKKLAE